MTPEARTREMAIEECLAVFSEQHGFPARTMLGRALDKFAQAVAQETARQEIEACIEAVEDLHAGAARVVALYQTTSDLGRLWDGKAIAYATVLNWLRARLPEPGGTP